AWRGQSVMAETELELQLVRFGDFEVDLRNGELLKAVVKLKFCGQTVSGAGNSAGAARRRGDARATGNPAVSCQLTLLGLPPFFQGSDALRLGRMPPQWHRIHRYRQGEAVCRLKITRPQHP